MEEKLKSTTNDNIEEKEKFLDIAKYVMKIVWPSMVEALLVALVVLLDGIMVANMIGDAANTAIILAKQPILVQTSLITVVNICITAIIARRRGQNDPEKANRAMHQGIQFSILVALLVALIFGVFSTQIAQAMASSDTPIETIAMSSSYLKVISFGFIFNALRLCINTAQRSIGNTKISLYTNVVANVLNVGLNFVLIPIIGIEGAALATILSNGVAMVISILAIVPKKNFLNFNYKYLLSFDTDSFKVFIKLFPGAFIEQMLMRIGFISVAMIVNKLGDTDTWVNGVCNDINLLMFTLADGFAIGTSAIVGRKLGENRKDQALLYSKVSMTISVSIAILVGIFMFFFRPFLISLYNPADDATQRLAETVMIIASLTVIPQNIQWVITGILRGSGDTKFTAMTSFISVVAIRPVLTFLLCYTFGFGLYGAWFGMLADQLIRMSLNLYRYNSKAWINVKV